MLPVKTVHSSTERYFSANPSFRLVEASFLVYWKKYCFIPSFFCQWKILSKLGGSQFLKTRHIPAIVNTNFFIFFLELLRFFKVEETFPYSGSAFFNKFFIWLVETDFLSSGNCFFISAIFLLVEAIIKVMGETVLKERAYCCQWTTDFLASGNHFSLIFRDSCQ